MKKILRKLFGSKIRALIWKAFRIGYKNSIILKVGFCFWPFAFIRNFKLTLTRFFPMYSFSTLWKHQETVRFSVAFRGQENGALGTNGSMILILLPISKRPSSKMTFKQIILKFSANSMIYAIFWLCYLFWGREKHIKILLHT